ncbi:ketopantoate reductase family protein [Bordetella tumulicola]|uniref:ketopantoate reductase family protein n=1 Tax=Bordetella tumulicola TaxID=1649133 RepID=UPI0039EFC9BD
MSPNKFTGRIAVIGAGAVGGFVGGRLAAAGYDVTLIDAWRDHVDAIRRDGLVIAEPDNEQSIPVRTLHVDDVSSLDACALDIVFICVKLYDTDWAASIVLPYLKPSGCVVTLQNSLVESIVASRVGWDRTLGCIGSGVYVALEGPGRIRRSKKPVKNGACVFYIGEAQQPLSDRVAMLADMLSQVDTTKATDNLWGLRWSKLVANTMTSGFSAVCGLGLKQVFGDPACCRIMLRLAAEAIEVGAALGYATEDVFGLAPDVWLQANACDPAALEEVTTVMRTQFETVTEDAISGTLQDLKKGKQTEVEFMNGFVAAKGTDVGVATPMHAEVAGILRCIEAGQNMSGECHLRALEGLLK